MGIITNIIKTLFTSDGASAVVKQTDTLGRAQTRLGQTSASSGRQFAAQASGLGGLVAAYAGAAATLFSVQAAFSALSKAAQAETLVRGTSALAAMTSQSGPRIISILKDITDGQLTVTEAAQNANIALSAGFNATQIEQFAEIAQKASRALGRDFTDSLQRIVRGVSKLEPELLDELGIFTRIEPAVQAYARQIGVASTSLNEFQRRQAFANAAIEEGNRKFSAIDTTSDSLQKTLEQLRVQITELGTGFLQIVGTALSPFASFLTADIGNALLAFGFLLSLVFGKSTELIGGFVNRTGDKVSGWAAAIADKAKLATGEIKNLQTAILAPVKGGGGGLSGIQTKPRALQDTAQAKRFADALEIQRTSATLLPSQLNAVNLAYKEQALALQKLGQTSSLSYANLNAAIARNSAVIKSSSVGIRGFITLSNTLRVSAGLLTTAFRGLAAIMNVAFGAIAVLQLAGSLFDVDLLGAVVNMFRDMSQATKEVANGFKGIAIAAGGGGVAITKALQIAGASEEQISGFGDRLATLRADVEERATSKGVTGRGGYIIPASQKTRIEATTAAIKEQQDLIAGGVTQGILGSGTSQEEIEQARIDLLGFTAILQTLQQESEGAARVVDQLAKATGLAGETIATLLATEIQNSSNELRLFGITVQKVNGSYTLENATDQQLKMLEAVLLTRNGVKDFTSAIESGSISAITASSSIAGLESQLLVLKASYDAAIASINTPIEATAAAAGNIALQAEIDTLEDQLVVFRAVEQGLLAAEKTFKDITSTFSKEITLFDTAAVTGLVNSYGMIATTQDQIDTNQAAYLKNVIDSTRYAKDIAGSEQLINTYLAENNILESERLVVLAKISQESETYDKATAAVQGKLVDITKKAYELANAYKEITTNVELQLAELNTQARLIPLQLAVDDLQIQQEAARASSAFKQSLLEGEIQLIELQVGNKKIEPVEGAEQINTIKDQILAAQTAALTEQFNISNQIITAERAILLEKTEQSQATIRAEAELQRSKLDSDFEVLRSAATIYSSIASQLETSLVAGGNAVGTAIVTAINSGVAAFVGSLGPLGDMLGLGSAPATFTPVPVSGGQDIQGPIGRGSSGFMATALGISELDIALASAERGLNTAKDSVTALEKAQLQASAKSYLAELAATEKKRELNREAYNQEIALLLQKGAITKEEAEKRLREAEAAGGSDKEAELTEIQKKLQALFDSIKGNIESALMSLNDLIFYGEGDFGDIIGNLFKSIQQDFFKQTVADPLSGFLTESLFGALGVKKGIDDALVYADGSLAVRIVSGPSDILDALGGGKGATTEPGAEGATGIFGGFFSQITTLFTNIFGPGGFLSNLFKSLLGTGGGGGFLSTLFQGIGSLFGGGMAQGGLVHLAAGGAASSSVLRRDRVPAMLEPGEFVLRKQAARKIGMPALQSMNANGTAGGAGNVSINVTNEGSPKQAEASQPRFDGEKYVVDVIMRDIASNGPIRRSLRSRGGL